MRLILQVFVGLAILLQMHQAVSAESSEKPTIVVLPLEVSHEGTYAYLNRVINQMLLTRLSQGNEFKVLGAGLKPDARQKIKKLIQTGQIKEAIKTVDADWFLDGSMYSLKDGLQVNVSLYPVSGGVPVILAAKADGEDEIIGAVGTLSKEIAEVVAQKGAEPEQTDVEKKSDELTGFETPHPERDFKKGLYGGTALIGGDDSDVRFESRGVRKSGVIPITAVSLASGDLDGDGTNELAVASLSKIRLFKYHDLKFSLVAEYDFSPRLKIHVINIADHDESGKMKLYVSGNEGKFASSAILSWNGSKSLQSIRQAIPWYLRPVTAADGKSMLIGQQANNRVTDDFLQPGVFELSIDPQNSQVLKGNKLLLPEGTNVFDFVQADLDGDGQIETMVIDGKQKLLVYDSAFNLTWVSSANYGGSKTYFGPSRGQTDQQEIAGLSVAEQDNRRLVFIPGRLDVKDITGDGLPEVVIVTNNVGVDQYFENVRSYDGGAISCLGWYGHGLAELWQTSHIEGYVADYFFDDTGNTPASGEKTVLNRLYVAQNPVRTLVQMLRPGGDESKILAFEMVVKKDEIPGEIK